MSPLVLRGPIDEVRDGMSVGDVASLHIAPRPQAYLEVRFGGYRERGYDILPVTYRLNVNGPDQPVAVPRSWVERNCAPEMYDSTGEPETRREALALQWDRVNK